MAYKVIPGIEGYGPRPGLEGPFGFCGRALYYDAKEGKYWDPRTDFYLEQSEVDQLNQQMIDIMKQ